MASGMFVDAPEMVHVRPLFSSGGTPHSDEPLYEIVNDKRVELPSMGVYSSWIATRLGNRLGPFVEDRSLGTTAIETLFILNAERNLRRRPDVAFVSAQRWPLDRRIPETGDWEVVPDLAVEIVSAHDLATEVHAKVQEYFAYGVRRVWVIYPDERQVYDYRSPTKVQILQSNNEIDGEDFLPGFRIAVSNLFQPPKSEPQNLLGDPSQSGSQSPTQP